VELRQAGFGYDARGSRGSARTRDPSRQGRVTVEQGQQVDEKEDVDGHGDLNFADGRHFVVVCTLPERAPSPWCRQR